MNKSYPRSKRVADQIQRTLSDLIRREVRDPRLGSITLTDVRVVDDLSHAKIFYSILGSGLGKGCDPELAQEILEAASGRLRGPLGRSLGLRHAPVLQFEFDRLIDEGARLTSLINKAVKADTQHREEAEQTEPASASDVTSAVVSPKTP